MANGNNVVSSDFLKVLLALKENIMKDIHCSELAIVKSIAETECLCSLLSNENEKINAYKMPSLEVEVGDIVQIIFSDSNFRSNLQKYNNNKSLQIVSNDRHSINNGVIIGSFRSKKENTSNLPLGTILTLSIEYDEPSLQKLDGRNLLQNGIYKDFCEWLKQRVNDSNVPICSINDYANEMTTYGQCGKFVINDTNLDQSSNGYSVTANSIKLPTITEFIASSNGGDVIGLAELDEFKSHNHYINDYADAGADTNPEAARINTNINTKTGYYNIYTGLTGGEETRPKNVRYPYYIVVATSIKTDVQVNLENVANDINAINSTLTKTDKIKVIYDAHSSDPNINLNKTGGILGGTWGALMLNLNAKGCYVYACAKGILGARFYIDLSIFNIPNPPSEFTSTGFVKSQVTVDVYNRYNLFGFNITMHKLENGFQFSVREIFEYHLSSSGGYTQHQDDAEYYVYKVEEVY